MSLRRVLRVLIKTTTAATCATNFVYTNDSECKKPTTDAKLKFDPLDTKKLTYEFMIQQSTIDAVNSATQALTITYTAILTTSKEYKTLLNELIALSKETLLFNVSDNHWDMIVDLRSEVQSKKETLTKLIGYVDYVSKMAVAASEICFLSGMDTLSITLSQRIDDALKNIKDEVTCIKALEQEYCDVQEQCIRNAKNTTPDATPDE